MTFEEFQAKFHINLTAQQTAAVQKTEGPSLLLAVPGSGKTTVLVTRLGYMIYCCDILPEQILTLTYTVAATKDMADRFCSVFGEELRKRMAFRTINSICMNILYYYGRQTGKQMYELISREDQRKAILANIYRTIEGDYATEGILQDIGARITYIKNMMLTQEEILALEQSCDLPLSKIYPAYVSELKRIRRIDYDDQMIYAYRILCSFPHVLNHFQSCYPYICVDEAQDTSKIQHKIIALLARKTENLFMVGDEDQSIYGFRAAYPQALLDFEKDHPGASLLLLEQNFRSNARIVAAADRFIRKNTLRHAKNMTAARKAGNEIHLIRLKNRKAQYTYLSKVAADSLSEQTAVLYRDNESAIPLIDLLERNGCHYRIKNADLSFFSHRVVTDIAAIIRLAYNPRDCEAFLKVYYKLRLYLTKANAENIVAKSQEYDLPLLDAALRYGHLTPYQQTACKAIRTHLAELANGSSADAMFRITGPMGYEDYLQRASIGSGKLFTLRTLAAREETPASFLERLSQLQDLIQNKPTDWSASIILSTIHGSKGLEYNRVYLLDVVDGVFPETVPDSLKRMTRQERAIWEEERRLFYVGMTRAKEELYLFQVESEESVFTKEVAKGVKVGQKRDVSVERDVSAKQEIAPDILQEQFQEFCENLGEGLLVRHKRFGPGVITDLSHTSVEIQFEDGTTKKFGLRILFSKKLLDYKN